MRHSKTTALISAASLAVMSILPAAQANAAAPDLSEFTAVPVFEFFNKNDVNGMIGIKLPETVSAHVEITFDSPEGLAFPYYVTDIKDGSALLFLIEGYSNTEDDYRNYHLSIDLTGGTYGSTVNYSEDFTVPDGNDVPDSFYAVGYQFELDDTFSKDTVELTGTETSTMDYNGQEVSGEVRTYALHLNSFLKGDINGDSVIDGTDATLALKEYAALGQGVSTLTAAQTAAADVNGSGNVDGSDATMILRYYALAGGGEAPDWDHIFD